MNKKKKWHYFRTVPNIASYYSKYQNYMAFDTPHGSFFFFFLFCVCAPNAKNLAFGIPDASAFMGGAHMLFFQINIHCTQVKNLFIVALMLW